MAPLFYVSIFRIEPDELAQPIKGSCGYLRWHAEVLYQATEAEKLTPFLVLYYSATEPIDDIWQAISEIEKLSADIVYRIILPIAFRADEHLVARLKATLIFDQAGNKLGGSLHTVRRIGNLGPNNAISGRDLPLLEENHRLFRALQYFNAAQLLAGLGLVDSPSGKDGSKLAWFRG